MMLTPSIKTLSRDLDMLRIEEDTPHGETSMVLPDLDRLRLVQDPSAGAEISMVLPGLDRLRLVEHSTTGVEDVFARLQITIPDFPPPGADHSTRVRYQLFKELKRLVRDPPAGISVVPPDFYDCNIMLWNVVIAPHSLDSPWEGGAFKLILHFSEDYPLKPPMVQFVSQMFHPNIFADGSLSLNNLLDRWTPRNDAEDVLKYIQSLICYPNPKCPANSEAFSMYFTENRLKYNRRVRTIVDQSWMAD